MYRFLLAGLYKNGRYFEDAFQEYKRVLDAAPSTYQARINLGNIYFVLGQYGEAHLELPEGARHPSGLRPRVLRHVSGAVGLLQAQGGRRVARHGAQTSTP